MSRQSLQAIGDASFARSERVSSELMALTYGSFVRQLLLDYEDPKDVNKQLDIFGYNIGVRLIDDFLAKSKINQCSSLSDTAEVIAKVAFKMFLGITANVTKFSNESRSFSLVFDENPLAEFTELPENCSDLSYSNLLCGVIRGALEMINMKVECTFERCKLRGDDQNEITVKLHEILVEQVSQTSHASCAAKKSVERHQHVWYVSNSQSSSSFVCPASQRRGLVDLNCWLFARHC